MKKNIFVLLIGILLSSNYSIAQVGIGTVTPDVNTMLDIVSAAKGILIPRMTSAKRDANMADNKESTIYPDNDPVLDPIPDISEYLAEGTLIFNTDLQKLQYWDAIYTRWTSVMDIEGFASGNDGSVLMNFPEFNESGAVKYNLDATLQYEYKWVVERVDHTLGLPQTNSSFAYQVDESVFGPLISADFDEDDFELADPPVTRWPENAENTTKSGIWDETNSTMLENPVEGQVHFWRVVIEYEVPNGNSQKGSIETSITNPNALSTFSTSSTTAIIDGQGGAVIKSTFLFLTIADSYSLPASSSGGVGYTLGFRANADVTISLRSILRVSIFKD